MRHLALAAAACLVFAPLAGAETILAPSLSHPTVQSAIDASSPGDTVVLSPGTYAEALVIDKSLTLEGLTGDPLDVTIQQNVNTYNAKEGRAISILADAVVRLRGLRFRNGYREVRGELDHAGCCYFGGTVYGDRLRLVGGSDTLAVRGVTHLTDSTIAGFNDYIFGPGTFVCDGCRFVTTANGAALFAPRTGGAYVVTNSKLVGPGEIHLARSPSEVVVFSLTNSYLGEGIRLEGYTSDASWPAWRVWECGNEGPGADRGGRVSWAEGCEQ